VLIIVGIIFGAILDEIDRCQPEVKDNKQYSISSYLFERKFTVNSNQTKLRGRVAKLVARLLDGHLSKIQNGLFKQRSC
jgi:hypothetical protein